MVNKQYTVQPARKQPNGPAPTKLPCGAHTAVNRHQPINNLDAPSASPDDDAYKHQQQQLASSTSKRPSTAALATIGGAVYARNIAYVHNHNQHQTPQHQQPPNPINYNGSRSEVTGMLFADANASERINNLDKDAAIKEIGRFQYILQMDREMATHPNSPAYRLHPHPNSATSTSNNSSVSDSINSTNNLQQLHDHSTHHLHHPQATSSSSTAPIGLSTAASMPHFLSSFWKTDGGARAPIAYGSAASNSSSSSSSSSAHGARYQRRWLRRCARYSNLVWMYAKWPLAAMVACSVVAILVYFALIVNSADGNEDGEQQQLLLQQLHDGAGRPYQHTDRDMTNEDFVRFTQNRIQRPNSQQHNDDDDVDGSVDDDIVNRTAQLMQLIDAVEASNANNNRNADDSNRENESISGRLAIFVQTPDSHATGRTTGNSHSGPEHNSGNSISQHSHFNDDLLLDFPLDADPADYETADGPVTSTHTTSARPAPSAAVTPPVVLTTKRFRNTQIIEISTPKQLRAPSESDRSSLNSGSSSVEIESGEQPQQQRPHVASTLMFPTRETFEIFGFTSGHQNSFGVPIEEDERMLRMLNEQLVQQSQTATTDSTMPATTTAASSATTLLGRTHVSPTLPNLRALAATTERLNAMTDEGRSAGASSSSSTSSSSSSSQATGSGDEGICESSALPLCRSVLPYDLTSAEHSRNNLTRLDVEHFKYLVESRCSPRAHEFICSVLQPECRPERMGILQPCKRSCKAILEPCGHVIAASEFLTAAFDCDSFPDSYDPEECRDATRDAECMPNEFQCDDRSCVPQQWRCDNIKDCSDAEDEIDCKFCEHDEFRCPTVDKCIPDKWRCDDYDDCPDAADEADCEPYDAIDADDDDDDDADADDEEPDTNESRTLAALQGHGRTFPYTQELSASRAAVGSTSTNRPGVERPATAATTTTTAHSRRQSNALTTAEDLSGARDQDELLAEESGVALPPLPKSLANFQDSKEIMMTSDSENDFKYATRSTLAGAAMMSSTLGTIVGHQQPSPAAAPST